MDQDIEMVPCETIDLRVPAHAEIVVEGVVDILQTFDVGGVNAPTDISFPGAEYPADRLDGDYDEVGKPIYRNHQPCRTLITNRCPGFATKRSCGNGISEIGPRDDVRFPTWGAAVSCIIQVDYPRPGFVNDALMQTMGSPWLNTKMVVAVSPDTDINDPGAVYRAMATRVDPSRDMFVVPGTRGSLYEPSGELIPGHEPWRVVGKVGIDATAKPHRGGADFQEAFPVNWGKENWDYL